MGTRVTLIILKYDIMSVKLKKLFLFCCLFYFTREKYKISNDQELMQPGPKSE